MVVDSRILSNDVLKLVLALVASLKQLYKQPSADVTSIVPTC